MTALQFARLECSNFESDGRCKGLTIADDGRVSRMKNAPAKCTLGTAGVRCQFFEECVAPMASRIEPIRSDLIVRRKEYEEAVREYRLSANVPQAAKRACKCGRPLEPYKQLCYVCREATRKEANRRKNQNRDKYTQS